MHVFRIVVGMLLLEELMEGCSPVGMEGFAPYNGLSIPPPSPTKYQSNHSHSRKHTNKNKMNSYV
jgi:hypothetical protein